MTVVTGGHSSTHHDRLATEPAPIAPLLSRLRPVAAVHLMSIPLLSAGSLVDGVPAEELSDCFQHSDPLPEEQMI